MLNNDSTDQIRATEMLEDMVHLSLNNVAAAAAAASASTSGNNNSGGGNSSSSTNSASSTASTVSSATSASATPAPPPPAPPTTTGHYSIWARKFKSYIFGAKIQIFYLFFRRLIIVIYVFFIREKCDQFGQFAAFGAAKGQAQPKDCQQPAEQQCWRKLQQCGHRQEQEVPIAGCATTAQPAVSPVATG